jgi:hypothetical protein
MSLRHALRAASAASLTLCGALWNPAGIPAAQAAPASTPGDAAAAGGMGDAPRQPPAAQRAMPRSPPAHPAEMPIKRPGPAESNDPISRAPPASAANAK